MTQVRARMTPLFLQRNSYIAGSLGLTLTKASVVILFEPNDTFVQEVQAIDRAHRIGQTESVEVLKFYLEDSIEGAVHDHYSDKAKLHEVSIVRNRHLLGNQELCEVIYDVDELECKTVTANDDFETIRSKLYEVVQLQPDEKVASEMRGAEQEEEKKSDLEQTSQPMVPYVILHTFEHKRPCYICF